MKVHHLSCATLCPPLAKAWLNRSGKMVCHCLLIETAEGLVLVDTGFGLQDVINPDRSTDAATRFLIGIHLQREETAVEQLRRLGFQPSDVRHILPTHMDFDHLGGLADFPDAQVHILATELDAAEARATFIERRRYRPAQWAHGPRWVRHQPAGEPWFGFACVRGVAGLPEDILIVPLHGHTRGHAGIAVRGPGGWLLHCGDAYFHESEVHGESRGGSAVGDPQRGGAVAPFVLNQYQRGLALDDVARRHNQERLRALQAQHGAEIQIFCAHDPEEFARAVGRCA